MNRMRKPTRSQNSHTTPNSQMTTGAAALGVTARDRGDDRVGDAAEEAPDVIRRIRLDDQPEQGAAEQRVHQRRQNEIRQVEVPVGENEEEFRRAIWSTSEP